MGWPFLTPIFPFFGHFFPFFPVGPKSIFWPFFSHFGPEARFGVCTGPSGSQAYTSNFQRKWGKILPIYRESGLFGADSNLFRAYRGQGPWGGRPETVPKGVALIDALWAKPPFAKPPFTFPRLFPDIFEIQAILSIIRSLRNDNKISRQ